MTIEDEADDFVSFWEDAHDHAPVMPQEVSWEILEDWGVGNSISFDQSRLKTGRTVLQLLSKRRMLWLKQLEIEGVVTPHRPPQQNSALKPGPKCPKWS